jgi:hypothetical protein
MAPRWAVTHATGAFAEGPDHAEHRVESLVVAGGWVAARLVEDDVVGEQGSQRIGVVHALERSRTPGPYKARGPTTRPPKAPSATAIFHH